MSASSLPPPSSKSPWKIVLFVALGLVGLCLVGCIACWVGAGQGMMEFGTGIAGVETDVRAKYGNDARIEYDTPNNVWTLAVGISGERTPEETREAQDWLWRSYATRTAKAGFPVTRIVIGRPRGQGVDWDEKDVVTVEELVKRTGVAPPVRPWWLPQNPDGGNVRIKVNKTPKDDSEQKPDDASKEDDAPR